MAGSRSRIVFPSCLLNGVEIYGNRQLADPSIFSNLFKPICLLLQKTSRVYDQTPPILKPVFIRQSICLSRYKVLRFYLLTNYVSVVNSTRTNQTTQ